MKLVKRIFVVALLIAIMLFVVGCAEPFVSDYRYICTLPIDDEFNQGKETLVFQCTKKDSSNNEGDYIFVFVDLAASPYVSTNIFDQIKSLEYKTNYHLILLYAYGGSDYYLCSISKSVNDE